MSKLINYLIVNVDNGKWELNKDHEHQSIAVPKMLNNLEIRTKNLLNGMCKSISKGMNISVIHRNRYTEKICKKIDDRKEEMNLHIFMLSDFRRKVEEKLEEEIEGSPLMKLKKMDSPLSKKTKPTISHIYERLDNTEIISRLNKAQEDLKKIMDILDIMKETWLNLLKLSVEKDPVIIFEEIKKINKNIYSIDEVYKEPFFVSDDITRGILNKGIHLKVIAQEVLNKLTDILLRTLVKGSMNYRKSKEQRAVEDYLNRLKDLGLYEEEQIRNLKEVKILLEIEPKSLPSYETCYKKLGEMYTNIHSKIFILKSTNHLRKYFSKELCFSIDTMSDALRDIHKNLTIDTHEVKKLEIYIEVIEELMMESNPGKEYFSLNTKLHKQHLLLTSQYHHLNKEHLFKCLNVIGSESFKNFIIYCRNSIYELRKERKSNLVASPEDILKIGMSTGKTTMIDTYHKAIDEILASLGTFVSNTLHILIQEILINIPKEDIEIRNLLKITYEVSEEILRDLNEKN